MATEEQIRELAYSLWEQDNRPDGKDVEHYYRAKQMLEEREVALLPANQSLPMVVEADPPVAPKPAVKRTTRRRSKNTNPMAQLKRDL
jgi:hypothetical protein